MRIKRIRVQNFKGFRDSGWISLSDGFNVVVGQNNSGKSALLEAFRLSRGRHDPFRSEAASDPHEINGESIFELDVEVRWSDWVEAAALRGGQHWFPAATSDTMTPELHGKTLESALQEHTYQVSTKPDNNPYVTRVNPAHGINTDPRVYVRMAITPDKKRLVGDSTSQQPNNTFVDLLRDLEPRRIVLMAAQRAISAFGPQQNDTLLTHNADNLATVLNSMSTQSPSNFRILIDHIGEVFPGIRYITTPITGNGRLEVRLWSTNLHDKFSKSISLADSGTGVAQAIAIFYVAIAYPRATLIIDEINSFLHPTALKKLLSILKTNYPQHQYVLSTHSTDVISLTSPDRVFLTRRVDSECKVSTLDTNQISGLREVASELGVSMADVFASDRIVWVEGETEEICFPRILRKRGVQIPHGTTISSVIGTGDLSIQSRGVELAYRLYEKISNFAAPLVSSARFSFDREDMKPENIKRLSEMTKGNLHILPRRMLENYVVDPRPLQWLLDTMNASPTIEEVSEWLTSHGGENRFRAPKKWKGDLSDAEWLTEVDGAKLISAMVIDLTGSTGEFRKTTHTPLLVDWMLENDPDALDELGAYVEALVTS